VPKEEVIERLNPILADDMEEEESGSIEPEVPRKVVEPTILADAEPEPEAAPDKIRIKAGMESDGGTCVFMVDRPILEGYSLWISKPEDADVSPLAKALFEIPGITTVQIHHMNLTVTRAATLREPWEPMAREIATLLRSHLEESAPVVEASFLDGLPPASAIQEKLETVIKTEINPGIAAHSGAIELNRVEGNTVYIKMMGGCQGCAASTITLKQGIHGSFRDAVPQVGAILDETDHSAGTNPFFTELPEGMRSNA
jgi:Fe-S cluster biogenesis protein NfuA